MNGSPPVRLGHGGGPAVRLYATRVVDPLKSMTGIGRYIRELTIALALARSDWSLSVTAPREQGSPGWLPASCRYRPVPVPRKVLYPAWLLRPRVRVETLTGDFDVLHLLHPSFPVPTRRPAVVTVHDLMPDRHPDWYSRPQVIGFRRVLRLSAERGWHVIADSEHVAGQLRELGMHDPQRVSVIPLAVGAEFQEPPGAAQLAAVLDRLGLTRHGYFLVVGNISTRKNLLMLLRAFAATEPGRSLVLAGNPHSSADAVAQEIDRLQLQTRVRLLGFVADENLPSLISGARALLHPSEDEGFGIPPLEAMALGTAVAAADAASLPEVVGDAGLLIDPTDPSAWASALDRLGADDDLVADLCARGRRRAADLTWAACAQRTSEVYARVLQG